MLDETNNFFNYDIVIFLIKQNYHLLILIIKGPNMAPMCAFLVCLKSLDSIWQENPSNDSG